MVTGCRYASGKFISTNRKSGKRHRKSGKRHCNFGVNKITKRCLKHKR